MRTDTFAEALASAVAGQDLAHLGTHLAPDARMRALLPGGAVQALGRDDVLGCFDQWFGHWGGVEPVEVVDDTVGGRVLVHYKMLCQKPETQPHVVTQTLLCGVSDGLVTRIDLLCSGFWEVR
jgi:hypothetical protein